LNSTEFFFKSFLADGTVSVKNVCVNYDGSYREICGYADVPDPSFPGELQVEHKKSSELKDLKAFSIHFD
jgi:hypothetical protein